MKKDYFIEALGKGNVKFTPSVHFYEQKPAQSYELFECGEILRIKSDGELYFDEITISETENGFVAKRSFKNNTGTTQKLCELCFTLDGISFGTDRGEIKTDAASVILLTEYHA